MELKYTYNGQEYVCDTDKLPAESVAYLLQYGWNQSLQDSMAGPVAKLKNSDEWKAETEDNQKSQVTDEANAALSKRADAICQGTVGVRVGVSRDPERSVAIYLLKVYAKSKGKKLPERDTDESKADFEILLKKFRDTNAEAITKEAKRREKVGFSIGGVEL